MRIKADPVRIKADPGRIWWGFSARRPTYFCLVLSIRTAILDEPRCGTGQKKLFSAGDRWFARLARTGTDLRHQVGKVRAR